MLSSVYQPWTLESPSDHKDSTLVMIFLVRESTKDTRKPLFLLVIFLFYIFLSGSLSKGTRVSYLYLDWGCS